MLRGNGIVFIMTKKKLSLPMCMLSNLMFPGVGLIMAGRRISGGIQAFLAIGCFIMALAAVIMPMFRNIMIMLDDRQDEFTKPDFTGFCYWATAVVVIWIWSTIEIAVFYRKPKGTPPPLA